MIDIRTLDIFQKFTGWWASIFFAAVYFYHCGMLDERHLPSVVRIAQYYNHDTSYWLLANEFLPLQIAAWGLFRGGFTWLFAHALMSFQREILNRIDYHLPGLPYAIFGLVCLGMGLLSPRHRHQVENDIFFLKTLIDRWELGPARTFSRSIGA